MKIKIFSDYTLRALENVVNEFLNQLDQYDMVKDIKFSTSLKDVDEMAPGNDARLFYSVMIVYVYGKG